MNKFVLLALCFVAVGSALAEDEKFTDKYDNVDIDEILKNDRLFNSYYKCLMDQGKCTPEGADLKRLGVALLTKAFGTFNILPPDLQPVVDNIYQTIKQEYETEADNIVNAKLQKK